MEKTYSPIAKLKLIVKSSEKVLICIQEFYQENAYEFNN